MNQKARLAIECMGDIGSTLVETEQTIIFENENNSKFKFYSWDEILNWMLERDLGVYNDLKDYIKEELELISH